ncbi:MAG: hypothetical protein QW468_04725 [Candidatus Bathyarchaeia archaeon]
MFGRSKVLKGSFSQLQRELSTITRVVIHPKYRTIGLGAKLIRETLPLAGTPNVETLAVMAKYNPFFEKAGVQKIAESKPNKNILEAIEKLNALGFNPTMLGSVTYNVNRIRAIGRSKIIKVLEEVSEKGAVPRKRLLNLKNVFPTHKEFMKKIEKADKREIANTLKRLSFLAQTKVCLFLKD